MNQVIFVMCDFKSFLMKTNMKRGVLSMMIFSGAFMFSGCSNSPAAEVPQQDAESMSIADEDIQSKEVPENDTAPQEAGAYSIKENNMELGIETTQQGSGDAMVKAGDTISVQYTGKLVDGTKFDSSYDRNGTPFSFVVGAGQVIKGWDQGLLNMKIGEKRKLTIPSSLGYGSAGAGAVIPPDATLIFEVELVSIQ